MQKEIFVFILVMVVALGCSSRAQEENLARFEEVISMEDVQSVIPNLGVVEKVASYDMGGLHLDFFNEGRANRFLIVTFYHATNEALVLESKKRHNFEKVEGISAFAWHRDLGHYKEVVFFDSSKQLVVEIAATSRGAMDDPADSILKEHLIQLAKLIHEKI